MERSAATRSLTRNLRLLVAASVEHLVDDPALFVVQVSRRLPFRVRMAMGSSLERIGRATGSVPVRALASYQSSNLLAMPALSVRTLSSTARLWHGWRR